MSNCHLSGLSSMVCHIFANDLLDMTSSSCSLAASFQQMQQGSVGEAVIALWLLCCDFGNLVCTFVLSAWLSPLKTAQRQAQVLILGSQAMQQTVA